MNTIIFAAVVCLRRQHSRATTKNGRHGRVTDIFFSAAIRRDSAETDYNKFTNSKFPAQNQHPISISFDPNSISVWGAIVKKMADSTQSFDSDLQRYLDESDSSTGPSPYRPPPKGALSRKPIFSKWNKPGDESISPESSYEPSPLFRKQHGQSAVGKFAAKLGDESISPESSYEPSPLFRKQQSSSVKEASGGLMSCKGIFFSILLSATGRSNFRESPARVDEEDYYGDSFEEEVAMDEVFLLLSFFAIPIHFFCVAEAFRFICRIQISLSFLPAHDAQIRAEKGSFRNTKGCFGLNIANVPCHCKPDQRANQRVLGSNLLRYRFRHERDRESSLLHEHGEKGRITKFPRFRE